MSFEAIPIDTINTFAAAKSWFDRFQQKVKIAFQGREAKPVLPVRVVASTGVVNQYQVTPSDVYLIIDARGGPIRIVFPVTKSTQSVIMLNAYQGGAVTLAKSDGKAFGNAPAVITLDYNKTTEMVNSVNGWFQFGRS